VVCIRVHVQQPPPPGNHTAAGPAGNHTQQPMYCQLGLLHWGCRPSGNPSETSPLFPVRALTLGLRGHQGTGLRAVREPLRNIPCISCEGFDIGAAGPAGNHTAAVLIFHLRADLGAPTLGPWDAREPHVSKCTPYPQPLNRCTQGNEPINQATTQAMGTIVSPTTLQL